MDCKPTRLLCPCDFPGKSTRVGCHFLLQGIFPTKGWNPGLLHYRQTLYYLSHQGSPRILKWVTMPFPGDHPNPRIEPAFLTSASDGGFFTTWEAPAKLDSVLKSRDITLPTKIHIVKAMVFTVVINRCESRTIKKVECQRTNAFKLWCWRRLLRVPWTARRSTSQS